VSAIPSKIPKPKVDHPIISKLRIMLKSYKCIKKPKKKNNEGFITFKNLFISTIPIVFIGFLIHLYDFNIIRNLEIIGWSTLGFGILLGIADTLIFFKKFIKNLNLKEAFIIGLFQILALIPGTSRSGIVITAGLFMGFSRYDASKYSLLLSIPVILAAMTLESFSLYRMEGFFFNDEMIIGIISSFCLAFLTIKLFMKWINKASLKIFVFYRIVLGVMILMYAYF
jgi:undecaprenyl-diphosphatase